MTNQEEASTDIFATIPKEETVCFIVPMYGYIQGYDVLNSEILQIFLYRLRSFFHQAYYVFVAERETIDKESFSILSGRVMQGNVKVVETEKHSTLSMYFETGLDFAINKMNSNYFVFATPWTVLGKDSVDVAIERVNKTDIGICSGFDVRKDDVKPEDFEAKRYSPAMEYKNFDVNFFAFNRAVAETIKVDTSFLSRDIFGRDIERYIRTRGYIVITSQSVPFYSYDIDWSFIEEEKNRVEDIKRFRDKWGYLIE